MDIKDFQSQLLLLLKQMDNICEQYNIKYSLFGGTMIGAIRDKGFISWDDDADVVFERKEFEKLIGVLPDGFVISRALWVPRLSHINNPKAYIDVFIFDKISSSKLSQKIQIFGLKAIQGTMKSKVTTNRGILGTGGSFFMYIIGLLLPKKFKLFLYDKLAQKNKNKTTDFIFSSLDQYKYIGHILPNQIVESYKKVIFEDTKLMVLEGYDAYLTKFYGDYMKPPPVEEQVAQHGNLK